MIAEVTRDEIVPVRHAVLRPNLPRQTCLYPEDDRPATFHLAARDADTVVACVTFTPEPLDGVPAWRLRGMAVLPGYRNKGLGGRLLVAGVAEVTARGGQLVWCNGRAAATTFYQRYGFTVRGEEFDSPPSGPHFRFVRAI